MQKAVIESQEKHVAESAKPEDNISPALKWEEESLHPKVFRNALGKYPTGVAIVATTTADGTPIGLTINSFASLSLEPPLVLWSLGEQSPNLKNFNECKYFTINVLAEDQQDLAMKFASSKVADKFSGTSYSLSDEGAPVIDGAIATLICSNEKQDHAGDHMLFFGKVLRVDANDDEPLVFHSGSFTSLLGTD
ncbi:flavin reductase family protein [Vibrio atypicus]|uniref:flavin reductase family protein n=1 Tax=Vibrio atypicus TaxID=558271 RepID=UPI00135C67DE|nr:flavin reductase family protein [Vibrio atypicus]